MMCELLAEHRQCWCFLLFGIASKKIGLQLSENKAKYKASEARKPNPTIQVGNNILDKVSRFKYLGAVITTNNDINWEMMQKLVAMKIIMDSWNIWWSLPRTTKVSP